MAAGKGQQQQENLTLMQKVHDLSKRKILEKAALLRMGGRRSHPLFKKNTDRLWGEIE
jgi:hypothetical protein